MFGTKPVVRTDSAVVQPSNLRPSDMPIGDPTDVISGRGVQVSSATLACAAFGSVELDVANESRADLL